MKNAAQTLEQYFPEMRWRCLSLAVDVAGGTDRRLRAISLHRRTGSDARGWVLVLQRYATIILDDCRSMKGRHAESLTWRRHTRERTKSTVIPSGTPRGVSAPKRRCPWGGDSSRVRSE